MFTVSDVNRYLSGKNSGVSSSHVRLRILIYISSTFRYMDRHYRENENFVSIAPFRLSYAYKKTASVCAGQRKTRRKPKYESRMRLLAVSTVSR